MKTKKYFLCKNYGVLLWAFYSVFCISSASLTNDCTECVGLDISLENITDSSESSTDYELSTELNEEIVDVFNHSDLSFLRFATPCETPNHEPSFCVHISECSVLSKVAGKLKYAPFVDASKCGPKNENTMNFKVCCGKYNSFRNVSKPIDDNKMPKITEDNKVFPKKCGTQRHIMRGRIFGGSEAAVGEYPWMARIIHKNNYGYKTYGCAGFLIHTKYILTAAHCIDSSIRGAPYSVVLGEHNTETKIDCSPGGTYCADPPQLSRINKIVVHPDYKETSKNHHNDIALINLKKAVRLTEYVQPICLHTDSATNVSKYYLSGWGKTESKISSPIKLKVDIPPFDKEKCIEKFQTTLKIKITDTQICAGGEKLKDGCNGDSGGPLMMSPNGTHFFAAGLVSYGIGCGMEGWPGVYTSIPSYLNWIETEILKISLTTRAAKNKKPRKKKVVNKT